jgi:hypothetical protein
MSAILKDEEFVAVEAAVKAGIAPQPVAAAFNELSALRAELKKLGEPESYYLKAMNCPHHHRIFAAEPRSYRDLPLRLRNTALGIATSRAASCSASCACARST